MNTNNTGIGEAINRVDGRLKVTGKAKYCTEFHVDNMVYAQGLSSTISAGRITGVTQEDSIRQNFASGATTKIASVGKVIGRSIKGAFSKFF